MKKSMIKTVLLLGLLSAVSVSSANGFFGNNSNGFGNFFGGNNNGYNDWPVWTPMYWMQEMSDSFGNNNRYTRYNGNYYPGPYQSTYQNPYLNPYLYQSPYPASPYNLNYAQSPYLAQSSANPYSVRPQTYVYRPAPLVNNYNTLSQGNFNRSGFSPFSGTGVSSFPSFGGGKSFSSNPMSSFSSSLDNSGFPPLTGMTSPMSSMGGFGSPMSFGGPLSMGMPGMNPMSSFGGGF